MNSSAGAPDAKWIVIGHNTTHVVDGPHKVV